MGIFDRPPTFLTCSHPEAWHRLHACPAVHHPRSGSSDTRMIERMFSCSTPLKFLIYNLIKSAVITPHCWVVFMPCVTHLCIVWLFRCTVRLWVFVLCVLGCALVSWSWLRVPGVLQRLGFTYFVLSLLQTFWRQREIPLTSVSSSVKFNFTTRHKSRKTQRKTNFETTLNCGS